MCLLPYLVVAVAAFVAPVPRTAWRWTPHQQPPAHDPSVSCYLLPNGTYACAHDADLLRESHPDDAY